MCQNRQKHLELADKWLATAMELNAVGCPTVEPAAKFAAVHAAAVCMCPGGEACAGMCDQSIELHGLAHAHAVSHKSGRACA